MDQLLTETRTVALDTTSKGSVSVSAESTPKCYSLGKLFKSSQCHGLGTAHSPQRNQTAS